MFLAPALNSLKYYPEAYVYVSVTYFVFLDILVFLH